MNTIIYFASDKSFKSVHPAKNQKERERETKRKNER